MRKISRILCTQNLKGFLLIMMLLVSVLAVSGWVFSAYEVTMDDTSIGIIKDKNVFDAMIADIEKKAEGQYNTDVSIANKIRYKRVIYTNPKVTANEIIRNKLEENIKMTTKAAAINVDGKDIVFLKDKLSAEEVLNKIKEPYIKNSDNTAELSFEENVNIIQKEIKAILLKNQEQAYGDLTTQSVKMKQYIVQNGDVISKIAQNLGISTEEIQKANPQINIDTIQIGQELTLPVSMKGVNVRERVFKTYEETIPYETKYESSEEIYTGKQIIKTKGEEGRKLVKAEIVKINGIINQTNIISENVIEESQAEILLQGTRKLLTDTANRMFDLPNRGTLTSRFGQRWGGKHTGMDIASPTGTPNRAAKAGIVTFAGWQGNYGKLVIIDHGNGYVTYYAHNDSLTVKTGQQVVKGQEIGRVGTTGRVTGPHLHFEVRKNGVPMDPAKYINE